MILIGHTTMTWLPLSINPSRGGGRNRPKADGIKITKKMKTLFQISDPTELLALWRLVAEAKFQATPDDADLWGSPFVHSLANKISDAMMDAYRVSGKLDDVERHQQWLKSLPNNIVLPVVKAQLKRDAQSRQWPVSYQEKVTYVRGCVAPFLASEDFIRQLIDDAESK
jgi:hypothetical protein